MWEIQPDRQMSQVDSLRIQQLLVDGIVQRKVVVLHSIPKLCAVLFAQKHDCLSCSCSEVVRLLDTMNEQIMHMLVVIVELNELFGREVREVQCEAPR